MKKFLEVAAVAFALVAGSTAVLTVHPQSAVAGEETTVAANHEIVRDPPNQTLGCVLFRERARPASRGKTAHS